MRKSDIGGVLGPIELGANGALGFKEKHYQAGDDFANQEPRRSAGGDVRLVCNVSGVRIGVTIEQLDMRHNLMRAKTRHPSKFNRLKIGVLD